MNYSAAQAFTVCFFSPLDLQMNNLAIRNNYICE
jgi:hypothetical protein